MSSGYPVTESRPVNTMESSAPTAAMRIFDVMKVPATAVGPRLNILMLADDRHAANVVRDHIDAIRRHSRHHIVVFNPIYHRNIRFLKLEFFDAVIIHYSLCVLFDFFLPQAYVELIRNYRGLKIQMIQDECRWVDRMAARIGELGIDLLFSSLTTDNIQRVYHHPWLSQTIKCSTLPGYVPDNLIARQVPRIAERLLRVVYRGRDLPYWLGRVSQEKRQIAVEFLEIAKRHNLRVDISSSEPNRIYGRDWIDILCSGKAVLATEGGASIFDFDGSVEEKVKSALAARPDADFAVIAREILGAYEGNIVHRTITPRSFEAIALKTALVMYPGAYRGILQPWRHYIPLERDGSNVTEVTKALCDDAFLQELVDRTYIEIIGQGKYHMSDFIAGVDRATDFAHAEHFSKKVVRPLAVLGSFLRGLRAQLSVRIGLIAAQIFKAREDTKARLRPIKRWLIKHVR